MAADARVLLARAQTQTLQPFPPLSTIDRFENGGLPVQLVLYQQTLVLYRIFTKTLREECSGGVRRRTWVRFGLRQPVKKTTSTCDNLVWLTCTRRVHPASRRSQVLYRVCAPGNRHGAPVPWSRDRRKGPTVAFSLKISNFCTLVQRISTIVLICGTKFVPVTLVYHGYRYRAPISVIVNYLNDTTVGQYRLTL
jgi:hypothetical protein